MGKLVGKCAPSDVCVFFFLRRNVCFDGIFDKMLLLGCDSMFHLAQCVFQDRAKINMKELFKCYVRKKSDVFFS